MKNEQIISSLDAMLENDKAKNFLNHMVRSYFPISKITRVREVPETPFKCALTRKELVVHNEENVGSPQLAYTGKDTTTFLSGEGLKLFVDWVVDKSYIGNKHICWLLNGVKRTAYLATAEQSKNKDVRAKANKIRDKNAPAKTASFKLGETNTALATLKAQMEKQGL
jgi:hypothetical protein